MLEYIEREAFSEFKQFKLFHYEFKISHWIHSSFNEKYIVRTNETSISKMFHENQVFLKQVIKDIPGIRAYPLLDVEIKLPPLDNPKYEYINKKWFINRYSSPWGSLPHKRLFTVQIQSFFEKRQKFWIRYFQECKLIKTVNEMCRPVCQTYYDLLQATYGITVSEGKIIAADKRELGDFPYLGSRRDMTTMFTVDFKRNPNNPGRLNQEKGVFLTMRKELRDQFLSLMLNRGFGQTFHELYSFGNIDIKAAHTYVVVVLMRQEMPILSELLKRNTDIWKKAETLSPKWIDFKEKIGQSDLHLKPFLKVLFYGALNGGDVSTVQSIKEKIEGLLTKSQLLDYSGEICDILRTHPIINEVGCFLKFCHNLDGRVTTPLQSDLVDKRSKPDEKQSEPVNEWKWKRIANADRQLASTLLQCVEYVT